MLKKLLRAFKWASWAAAAAMLLLALDTGVSFYQVSRLEKTNPETTPFMAWKLRNLRQREKEAEIDRRFVPYDGISENLKRAVRLSEDPSFFEHGGFDWAEMKIAYQNWRYKGKRLRGASTLSMQTARLMLLTPARNPLRKLREAVITALMEKRLSKRRIFELYLNYADWGNGVFGAEAAARRYLGKSCASLSCSEAAALAAMLPSPDTRGPGSPSRAYARHKSRLMKRMRCGGGAEGRGSPAGEGDSPLKEDEYDGEEAGASPPGEKALGTETEGENGEAAAPPRAAEEEKEEGEESPETEAAGEEPEPPLEL